MKRALILIPLLPAAAGCAGEVRPIAATPAAPAWIVGAWVAGSSCESDAGVRFMADGTYHVLEDSGTWTLAGDRLTTRVLEVHEEAGGDSKVGDTFSRTIRRISDVAFQYVEPDGSGARLKRCPG